MELELRNYEQTAVSERTIRRRLKESGIKTYSVRKIPYITPKNKKRRLQFAKDYVNKPLSFWQRVIWTDESSFEFHGSPKKMFVRLPQTIRNKFAPITETVRHGGGTVMFWGCISAYGCGELVPVDGMMNQQKYLSILNDHAFASGDKLIGESFILQQDNAPCHKGRLVTSFLRGAEVETLNWPPQSPDLNIIENVWGYIKGKRCVSLIRDRNETISEVQSLWKEVSVEMLCKLVEAIPKRLQKVIIAKGGYIFN